MANWLGKLHARWQAGEIDDRGFERAQLVRARTITGVVFAVLIVLIAAGMVAAKWNDDTSVTLVQILAVTGGLLLLGGLLALRVGSLARDGARSMVLARNRARIEANPAQGLPKTVRAGSAAPTRYFGCYKRSIPYAFTVLRMSALSLALTAGLGYWRNKSGYEFSPILAMLGAAVAGMAIYGLYMIADRRVYLELSADGIWCRAWGKERFPFSDFRAVYARQRGIRRGIVFVPRRPDEFRKRLWFWTRLSFRSGGGVQAHAGTVTLWTTQVDLPQDALLREVQAEVVHAAQG